MDRPTFLKEMIQQYREKIRLYEAMIAEFEREIGNAPSGSSTSNNGSDTKNPSADPLVFAAYPTATNAIASTSLSVVPQRFNSTSQPDGNPIVRPELNSVTKIVPRQAVAQTSSLISL